MSKFVFSLLTLTLTLCFKCGSAGFVVDSEPDQTLEGCIDRFPPAFDGFTNTDETGFANTTRWYLKYADGTYLSRSLDVFFAGQEEEDRPPFDSPCWTVGVDGIEGENIEETSTIGAVGISISAVTTISSDLIGTTVLHLPNSDTPALTVKTRPVLCDGESYVLQFSCLPEGDFGFQVFTNTPELDASAIYEIEDYLEDFGFEVELSDVTTYSASQCTNEP